MRLTKCVGFCVQFSVNYRNEPNVQLYFQHSGTPGKTRKSDEARQSSSVVSTTQNYASNVKSGAAAFFGAMSQDWFKS